MTITLPPQIETRLRWKAAHSGQEADVLAKSILAEALLEETLEELREEYHQLISLELRGELTEMQASRLHQVTQQLDDRDAASPAAQIMAQSLEETGRKLDEMLNILRSLPIATQTL